MAIRTQKQTQMGPKQQKQHQNEQLISIIAQLLENMLSVNDLEESPFGGPFHSEKIPKISILSYLDRFVQFSFCPQECLVLTFIYLQKVPKLNPFFLIDTSCIHRLLLASFVVSAKQYDNIGFGNVYYAKMGGVSPDELNKLEMEFTEMLDNQLEIEIETIQEVKSHLEQNQFSEICNAL